MHKNKESSCMENHQKKNFLEIICIWMVKSRGMSLQCMYTLILLTKMPRIVNRSLRIVLQVDRYTPVNTLYDMASVMKLYLRVRFYILKVVHHKVYGT